MDGLKYLVTDIETIPAQSLPDDCRPKFDESTVAIGNLKDPWKIKEKIEDARAKFETDLDKTMSVSPDLCQVCCLGYGDGRDQQAISAMDDQGEYELIIEAWSLISSAYQEHIPIVTFNGMSFDIPVLLRRAMLLDISVAPGMVAHLMSLHDNRRHFDLMRMLAFRNPFSGKLEAKGLNHYLHRFGLGSKTEGMDGSQVYPAWKENRHSDIMNYCKQDIEMTALLFERTSPWLVAPRKRRNNMALTAKDPGGTGYAPPEEGVFQAVCYGIYDLGSQFSEKWNKTAHRVLVSWEIPELRIELEKDGKTVNLPRGISKEYTLSLHQKAQLRKDLENWRGRTFTKEELAGFDLQNILKANCMIQIIHSKKDDKTYANVSAILPLMKQIKKLSPENPVKFFSFEDANPTIPEDTPQWVIDKIQDAKEWTGENGDSGNGDEDNLKPPAWLSDANSAPMAEPAPESEIPF